MDLVIALFILTGILLLVIVILTVLLVSSKKSRAPPYRPLYNNDINKIKEQVL